MPGGVFKAIAEGITVREMIADPIEAPIDTIRNRMPNVKNGLNKNTTIVLDKLKQKYTEIDSEWIRSQTDSTGIKLVATNISEATIVPNVIGMGLRDAIYLLENAGLTVHTSGAGKVYSQSLSSGSRFQKGSKISISLK